MACLSSSARVAGAFSMTSAATEAMNRDFVLIILEIYHNETTTQSLLIRKGSHNGGGVGSRDPSAWVPLSDEEFPIDVLTDDSRDFLEDFCS